MQLIKPLLLLLLTLALSGQAFSVNNNPCENMQTNAQMPMHGQMMMEQHRVGMNHTDESAYDKMSAAIEQQNNNDCCEYECKCSGAACGSFALINHQTLDYSKVVSPSTLSGLYPPYDAQSEDLIRPPIAA